MNNNNEHLEYGKLPSGNIQHINPFIKFGLKFFFFYEILK